MALLEYKPRPRMRSWAAPEPPPPRPSWYLWVALLAWFGALYLGYRLVWPNGLTSTDDSALDSTLPVANLEPLTNTTVDERTTPEVIPQVNPPTREPPAKKTEAAELPGCEGFLAEARGSENERMPAQLGRSAISAFVGETAWLKPCRGRKNRTLRFCAAIRDGALVGLSLHAEPADLTLENCVRDLALKVPLRAEPSLRLVETRLSL